MGNKRRDEKERLWNEVLGRKRAYESDQASKEIELSIDAHEKEVKETLKSADYAMDELNRILLQQQKDLDALSNEMKKPSSIDISNMDMDQLEADIRRDYGTEEEKKVVSNFDSATVFDEIYNVITSKIMGQKDALRQMIIAFRRPYVMGEEKGMPKNVILVSGPRGSGRHEAVMEMARSLSEKNVFA